MEEKEEIIIENSDEVVSDTTTYDYQDNEYVEAASLLFNFR